MIKGEFMNQIAWAQNISSCYTDSPYYGIDKWFQSPLEEPGSVMDFAYKALSVIGSLISTISSEAGLAFHCAAQVPKVIRNFNGYQMSLAPSMVSDTNIGFFNAALKASTLFIPQIRPFVILIGVMDLLEEGALMRDQEAKHLLNLKMLCNSLNTTNIQAEIDQLRLNRPESHTQCNVLFQAIEDNNPHLVTELGKKANLFANPKNEKGETPLHLAVMQNKPQLIRALSNIPGIDFEVVNKAGDTSLAVAVNLKLVDVAKELVIGGANTNFYMREGYNLAQKSYLNDDLDFFKVLALNATFNPTGARNQHNSLPIEAIEGNRQKWIDYFFQLYQTGSDYQKRQMQLAYQDLLTMESLKNCPGYVYFQNKYLEALQNN